MSARHESSSIWISKQPKHNAFELIYETHDFYLTYHFINVKVSTRLFFPSEQKIAELGAVQFMFWVQIGKVHFVLDGFQVSENVSGLYQDTDGVGICEDEL